jgi:hypothetical protein
MRNLQSLSLKPTTYRFLSDFNVTYDSPSSVTASLMALRAVAIDEKVSPSLTIMMTAARSNKEFGTGITSI